MASALYREGAVRMMAPTTTAPTLSDQTALDMAADTIRAVFLASTYTFSQTHNYFDDLGANTFGHTGTGAILGGAGNFCPAISSKTFNAPAVGVFDAADTVYTTSPASGTATAVAIFKDTGTTTTSPLLCYIDGFTSVVFNGGSVTMVWDSGANAIWKLVG